MMKRMLFGVLILCVVVMLAMTGNAIANSAVDGDAPAMMASPSVIVLAKVSTITVHTNIVATAVETGSVALNGVAPIGIGADNLGHLTAKFALAELKLVPGEATLTLSGTFKDASDFSASDMVRVL